MQKELAKLIAFYLPQYHINNLNNELWGDGFTEWTNVAQGRPNFVGHYQPHIPGKLGFYDLSFVETISKQVDLAKSFGIYGFCFYYYWFDGKRALELPLNLFLDSNIQFPFCICWANENWSKKWDGGNNEVVLKQNYAQGFENNFILSLERTLKDERYIKLDSKPVLLIYRPSLFSKPAESIKKMREAAKKIGIDNLCILVVDFYLGDSEAKKMGADGIVEFPPHQFYGLDTLADNLPGKMLNPNYSGHILDYRKMFLKALDKWNTEDPFLRIRGIIPSWDNTARRKDSSVTVINCSPELYENWLNYLVTYSKQHESPYIFINAWNEWGEGCHLEPDRRYGCSYLEATKRVLDNPLRASLTNIRDNFKSELTTQLNTHILPQSATEESIIQEITLKDYIKSKLFRHPKLFELARKLYKNYRPKK
ncbi:glycoside hydrolase family 99-like domain-containing protein [uncultured Parasutterella sp.]|uniref:glycoside hydrolase family 99-like domain-containing protein n=1 Tax=uncultured Parasutterella sp. TaxID=1263098 RepID=UPI0025B654C9|nr:glycoside hydrolase family 99-like domain-containing protein [uncultured Parasutterella sp.]